MSRKVLIVAVVLGLLVATLATPAMAAPLKAHDVASTQTKAWASFGGGHTVLLLPPGLTATAFGAGIRLNGGCETGGAGGCPVQR
jgi:hypothetical protein